MITELYIEETPDSGIFSPLDLYQDESLNLEFKLKDITDLSKVFGTYSKEFTVPASDENNRLLNHYFDQSLSRGSRRYIRCKIYLNQQLYKVGQVSITQGKYKQMQLETYKIAFTSGLTNMKDKIGEDELNQLDFSDYNLQWTPQGIKSAIETTNRKVVIPMISRERVWSMDWETRTEDNNILLEGKSFIGIGELRPAIKVKDICRKIFSKYDLNINFPLMNTTYFDELYLWLNNTLEGEFVETAMPVKNPLNSAGAQNPSAYFSGSVLPSTNTMLINFTGAHTNQNNPYQLVVNLADVRDPYTDELFDGKMTITVTEEDGQGNTQTFVKTIDSNNNAGGFYYVTIPYPTNRGQGTKRFTYKMKASKSLKYQSAGFGMRLLNLSGGGFWQLFSPTNPSLTLGSNFNFSHSIGNIKTLDFLSSIFKMHNIRIIEDQRSDLINLYTINDYTPRTIDLTPYMDVESFVRNAVPIYRELTFTHRESDFFRNDEYQKIVGKEYGSESFTSPDSTLSEDYTVETDFLIMNWFKIYGGDMVMSYGFSQPGSPVDTSDNIVIMAYQGRKNIYREDGQIGRISIGPKNGNVSFNNYNVFTNQVFNSNLSITYDIDISAINNEPMTNSLYKRYYSSFIERVYNPNSRITVLEGYFPTPVLYDFSMLDEYIIGDIRFTIEEASIDVTTGKNKLTIMNIVPDSTRTESPVSPPQLFLVTADSDSVITATFNGSSTTVGNITGHTLRWRKTVDTEWETRFVPVLHNNQVSYMQFIEDLEADTNYTVEVRAEAGEVVSEWLTRTVTTLSGTDESLPQPILATVSSPGNGELTFGWRGVTSNEPGDVTQYQMAYKLAPIGEFVFVDVPLSSNQDYTHTVSGLVPGIYVSKVRAKGDDGKLSKWSAELLQTVN